MVKAGAGVYDRVDNDATGIRFKAVAEDFPSPLVLPGFCFRNQT